MASQDGIIFEIKDGIAPSIDKSLQSIEKRTRSAATALERLNKALSAIQPKGLAQLESTISAAQRELDRAALSSQKLATEQARTATAAAQAAAAQQRLATAVAQTTAAEARAEGAVDRLQAAQARRAATLARTAAAEAAAQAATEAQTRALAAQEVEVARVQGIHERFAAVLERTPKYQAALGKQTADATKKLGLQRYELVNLGYQVNDVIVSLASGQKPLTVAIQQGAQIGQIFGASGVGVGAIFKQLAGIVGSLLLRLAPFAIAITAAAGAFALFSREINKGLKSDELLKSLNLTEEQLKKLKKSGEDTSVTFMDTFKAAFQVIGRYVSEYFEQDWSKVTKIVNNALDFITNVIENAGMVWVGMFLSTYNVIKYAWENLPGLFKTIAVQSGNNLIEAFEKAVNAINAMIASSPIGKFLNLQSGEIKIPRIEDAAGSKGTDEYLKGLKSAFVTGAQDAVKIVKKYEADVSKQAIKNAKDRLTKAAGEAKGAGHGFNRARELEAVNEQLDREAKNMFVLSDARDAYNKSEEVAIRFKKAGFPLTETEIKGLRDKMQAINDAKNVQKEYDRIYQSATGPQVQYNASLDAAKKLLDNGAISQERYNAEVARAKDAYATATVPFAELNKEIDEQISLTGLLNPAREVEQQLIQAKNKALAAGLPYAQKDLDNLKSRLELVQKNNLLDAARNQLMDESSKMQSRNFGNKADAASGLLSDPNSGYTSSDAIRSLSSDVPALEDTTAYFQSQVDQYTQMYAKIKELRDKNVIDETTAAQAIASVHRQQLNAQLEAASSMFGDLATLRDSDNKAAARIGKAAAIAQATINTYQAATAAYASGAKISPIYGAIAAATAVAAGIANVQKIRSTGYMSGGYTGGSSVTEERGIVHGREFVFDAKSTRQIGVNNLEAIRKGANRLNSNAKGGSSAAGSPNSSSRSTSANSQVVNTRTTVQNLNVTIAGTPNKKTPDQIAKANAREAARASSRG